MAETLTTRLRMMYSDVAHEAADALAAAEARAEKAEATAAAHIAGWTKQCEANNVIAYERNEARKRVAALEEALGKAHDKLTEPSPMLPCRVDEMTGREHEIFKVAAELAGRIKYLAVDVTGPALTPSQGGCPTCGGVGEVPAMIETDIGLQACPYIGEPCPTCQGGDHG